MKTFNSTLTLIKSYICEDLLNLVNALSLTFSIYINERIYSHTEVTQHYIPK